MNKFFSFLAGFFVAVALLGAGLAWYVVHDSGGTAQKELAATPIGTTMKAADVESTAKPVSVPEATKPTAPGKVPDSSRSNVESTLFIAGSVSIPPSLRKILETKKNAIVSIRAFVNKPDSQKGASFGLLRANDDIKLQKIPHRFRLEVAPGQLPALLSKGSFMLFVRAQVCYDEAVEGPGKEGKYVADCNADSVPSMVGNVRFKVDLPSPANFKSPEEISVPTIVLRNHNKKPDLAACKQSGGTISGRIQPTPAFLAIPNSPRKFVLTAIPWFGHRPPSPFYAEEPVPVSTADLAGMVKVGISRQALTLQEGKPTTFSIKVPDSFQGAQYFLYVSSCAESQSEDDCTAATFPVYSKNNPRENKTLFHLIPSAFETPHCGMSNRLFYLHYWKPDAPPATEASVFLANPPELIEGTVY